MDVPIETGGRRAVENAARELNLLVVRQTPHVVHRRRRVCEIVLRRKGVHNVEHGSARGFGNPVEVKPRRIHNKRRKTLAAYCGVVWIVYISNIIHRTRESKTCDEIWWS